jgi:alkanesulfonate monooxygenase SsuD/methylene tetrahydromethanopterin reductase-like flavin-dependent oxidoreductase (luciferase family)
MRAPTNPIFNTNRMKIGIFAINGKGGIMTTVPEVYEPTWDLSVKTAQMADEAGYEAIVSYARWKGWVTGDNEDSTGLTMDPFTWAAGIAQATRYSAVFATSHAPTIHPILAAKQSATIDLISGGRFGINVVGGWNKPELEMFGAPFKEHDRRYDHLAEWLTVIRQLWQSEKEFDFHGDFFDIVRGSSMPKPIQKPHPAIMNAGGSERGRRFACENADMCFLIIQSESPASIRKQVEEYKTLAREEFGREVQVWTNSMVMQRDTQAEADAYYHHCIIENEDKASVDAWMAAQQIHAQLMSPEALLAFRQRMAGSGGGFPLIGSAARIAERLNMLADCGLDGILLTWVDPVDGIERFSRDVLPLMERSGLRAPFAVRREQEMMSLA